MKKGKPIIIFIIGALILALGIVLGIIFDGGKYPGFAAGLGSSWVALGIVGLIRFKLKPELVKQGEINEKDERLIHIREKSGNLAFFISVFANVAVVFTFLIMDNLTACFIVITSMLLQWIIYFIALYMNNKRM